MGLVTMRNSDMEIRLRGPCGLRAAHERANERANERKQATRAQASYESASKLRERAGAAVGARRAMREGPR